MNTKRMMLWMKSTLLVAVVFAMGGMNSCSSDDPAGPIIYDGSLLELINDAKYKEGATVTADNALDSLAKLVNLYPSLQGLLGGTTTDFTLFAPSNTAFINLLATPGFPAKISDINPNLIEGVLAYHVTDGKLAKADLTPTGTGAGLDTYYSDTNPCTGAETVQVIKVNADGTLLTGSTNAAIQFQTPDNFATKGVMHIMKTVLIPPSVGEDLTPLLGTVAGTVLLADLFSDLAMFITKADCGVAGVTPLASILANPAGTLTAFLPPNAVFEGTALAVLGAGKTPTDLLAAFTAQQCRNIVLNHILGSINELSAFTAATTFPTYLGGAAILTVTVTTPSAQVPTGILLTTSGGTTGISAGTSNSPILLGDITASNGVSHVVGKILLPN